WRLTVCCAVWLRCVLCFFFFQAEDGIRDWSVTGVQTCALPILGDRILSPRERLAGGHAELGHHQVEAGYGFRHRVLDLEARVHQIGRASCRERGGVAGGGGALKEKEERWGRVWSGWEERGGAAR